MRIKLDIKCTGPFFTSARTYKTRPRAEEDHHPKNYIYIYIYIHIYVARETKQFVCTVPVRSFERSAVSHYSLFSFNKRLIYCFCGGVLLVSREKKLKCLVPQFFTQFYTNHTQSTHGTFSFSLSVSSTDEDAFFLGFLAGEIV